jgi:hypothetical protein
MKGECVVACDFSCHSCGKLMAYLDGLCRIVL